jgi:hypothetical protein
MSTLKNLLTSRLASQDKNMSLRDTLRSILFVTQGQNDVNSKF